PQLLPRRQHHDHGEEQHRRDLDLRGSPVHGRIPVDVQDVRVARTHQSAPGSDPTWLFTPSPPSPPPVPEPRRRTSQKKPAPTANVTSTPTTPEMAVERKALSTPATP